MAALTHTTPLGPCGLPLTPAPWARSLPLWLEGARASLFFLSLFCLLAPNSCLPFQCCSRSFLGGERKEAAASPGLGTGLQRLGAPSWAPRSTPGSPCPAELALAEPPTPRQGRRGQGSGGPPEDLGRCPQHQTQGRILTWVALPGGVSPVPTTGLSAVCSGTFHSLGVQVSLPARFRAVCLFQSWSAGGRQCLEAQVPTTDGACVCVRETHRGLPGSLVTTCWWGGTACADGDVSLPGPSALELWLPTLHCGGPEDRAGLVWSSPWQLCRANCLPLQLCLGQLQSSQLERARGGARGALWEVQSEAGICAPVM